MCLFQGIWFNHFIGNRWGNSGNSVRLYFLRAPKSLQMVTAAMKLKDAYSLEEEGNAQGLFHVEYPRETMELLVLYPVTVFDECFQQTPEQQVNRVQAFIHNTEILLGAEAGSMAAPMARIFQQGSYI